MPSERAKMLSGALYRGSDPELVTAQVRAHRLLERFNQSDPANLPARRELLGQLFGRMGEGVTVRPRFACDYGSNIAVGRDVFINFDCVFLDCAAITLGDDVQVAPGVHLYTAEHPVEPTLRRKGLEYALPITLGDDVWLGGGVIVCPGVTVGEGTAVGAGSVVIRDLPPFVVAAGNPCRVLRDARTGPPHRAREL
jgi:maltose O-acetyltransferase